MRKTTCLISSAFLLTVVDLQAQTRAERDAAPAVSMGASAPLFGPPPAPAQFCIQPPGSSNCMPTAVGSGSQSLSIADTLVLTATNCPTDRMGSLVWNIYPVSLPFGSSTLCIPRGIGAQLMPPNTTGAIGAPACSGMMTMVLDAQRLTNNGAFAGSTVYAQFVFRTPRAIGSRLVLSNAVSAEIAP